MERVPSFAQVLKQRRKALDLTQQDLALQVGCALVTIQRIEQETLRPSRRIAQRLAAILAIPADEQEHFVLQARIKQLPESLLPVSQTVLIGREEAVMAVRQRLSRADTRLLTLTGPPGIGKTRLGLAVSAEMLDNFADGVFFIPLAQITDPALVCTTIVETLGLQEIDTLSPLEQLKTSLRHRQMLLLLDNFEHILAVAPQIAELLSFCSRLKILVTSRAPLRLRSERQFSVSPLSVPDLARLPNMETIARFSAVALFMERAQAVNPDFALTEANAPAVAALCIRLDGLPLAIELISARIKLLPPMALLERLHGRLLLQSDGWHDIESRHRTLNTAIEWSYQLLSADEQMLFRRLGVFVSGWTLEAAETVCQEKLTLNILDGLASLLDKNLIKQETGADDAPRFIMLETIREYALEQLVISGDQVHDSHCKFYTSFLAQCWTRLTGSEIKSALHEINVELKNIQTAWDWAVSHQKLREIEITLDSLWFFYDQGNRYYEGQQLFARAATSLKAAASEQEALWELWAKVIARQGALCRMTLLRERAKSLLEDSVSLLRHSEARTDLAFALVRLAAVTPEINIRVIRLQESLAIYSDLVDHWGMGEVLNWLCVGYLEEHFQHGQPETLRHAYRYAYEGLAVNQQLNSPYGIARACLNLGKTAYCREEYDQAREYFQKGLDTFQDIGIYWGIPNSLWHLGYCAYAMGDYAAARRFALDGLRVAFDLHMIGNAQFIYPPLIVIAEIYLQEGETEQAYELFGLADQWRQQVGFSKNYIEFRPLSRLDREMSPALIAAVMRGQSRTLDAVVKEVLRELSRHEHKLVSTASQFADGALIEPLSSRELQVLQGIAAGLSNKEIAEQLIVEVSTVKKHITHLYDKFAVQTRTQALLRARELHLL